MSVLLKYLTVLLEYFEPIPKVYNLVNSLDLFISHTCAQKCNCTCNAASRSFYTLLIVHPYSQFDFSLAYHTIATIVEDSLYKSDNPKRIAYSAQDGYTLLVYGNLEN